MGEKGSKRAQGLFGAVLVVLAGRGWLQKRARKRVRLHVHECECEHECTLGVSVGVGGGGGGAAGLLRGKTGPKKKSIKKHQATKRRKASAAHELNPSRPPPRLSTWS